MEVSSIQPEDSPIPRGNYLFKVIGQEKNSVFFFIFQTNIIRDRQKQNKTNKQKG